MNPCLSVQRLEADWLDSGSYPISRRVIEAIELDYYAYVYIEEFYVKASMIYRKNRRSHAFLIFGYDLEEQTFDIAGFFKNGKYSTSKISFNDFDLASIDNPLRSDFEKKMYLFKKRERIEYGFDPYNVSDLLQDYLSGNNSSRRFRAIQTPLFKNDMPKGYFGIRIYEPLKDFVEEIKNGTEWIDLRPFHVLWDHKNSMLLRIGYMMDNGYLPVDTLMAEQAKEIRDKAMMIRTLLIKYSFTPNPELLDHMIRGMDHLAGMETYLFTEILETLSKNQWEV